MSFPTDPPLLTKGSGRIRESRKLTRRAFRARTGLFLAEGRQAVREALELPGCVREVFAIPGRHDDLRATAPDIPWHDADEAAVASLSETVSPQGVVAVCVAVDRPLSEVVGAGTSLAVLCADIRDPGNAGTVLRCADAVGADAVVLAGDSVDPYNGKAVRASVGSLFHVPVATGVDVADAVRRAQQQGLVVLAADGAGEIELYDETCTAALAGPVAWIFGNEAWGLPVHLAAMADHRVRIPILGRAESLNLATAAAVCLYATVQARRGS